MYHKLSLITLTAVISATIHAQAQQGATTSRLDAITVEGNRLYGMLPSEGSPLYTLEAATVGTKIPAALRDIPQSVSIITQQAMRDRNVATFDQLAVKTPGLRVMENDEGRSSVFARGYEYDEYNVDGLPAQMQSINGTLPSLAAFDRVEIMRGPSGLFNSAGEMGGIVNFVRKRPSSDFAASVEAMGGNFAQYRFGADVGGALTASGNVRGRALVNANGKTPQASDGRNHAEVLYGALDIDLAERTTLGFGYLYQQRNLKPDNGLPTGADGRLLALPNHDFYGAPWNDFSMHSHDFFADLKHEFNNGGYGKIGLRYSDRGSEMNYVFSQTGLGANGGFTAAGLGADVQQQAFALDASYSQPFAAWDNVSEYVLGVDVNRMTTRTQRARARFPNMTLDAIHTLPQRDILGAALSSGRGFSDQESTLTDFGAYGKLTLRPIQPLAVIVGGRLSHWTIDTQDNIKHTGQRRQESARFTGYGGVVYDINANHSLYASYSSLYAPQTELDRDGNLIRARQGQQYEVGIKGSYAGDRLQTRLSLFQLTDRHAAAPVPNENYHAAIGKRTVKGVEAEINGEITAQWTLSAGYTHLKTDVDLDGDRQEGFFLLMPRHSGNLWSTYRINDQWTVGGGVTAMSGFESSQGVSASGYATVDAMLAYRVNDNLHAQLNINNLFDRDYYKRVGSVGTFNMPGEGRSISASVRYDF